MTIKLNNVRFFSLHDLTSLFTQAAPLVFFITIFTECQAHTGSTCRSGCSELVWGAIAFLKPPEVNFPCAQFIST